MADDLFFATSRLVARELVAFNESCHCTARIEQKRHRLHQTLDSVVVFDLRFGWWGIGNSLIRWINLIQCGLALGRASFLWMSDEKGGDKKRQLFDMGQYFTSLHGEAASWRWSPRAEARVRAAQGLDAKPVTFKYQQWPNESFWLYRESPARAGGRHKEDGVRGSRLEEMDGKLFSWLAARRERWIVVDLRPRWQGGFEHSRQFVGAVLSGQLGTGFNLGWDAVCGAKHPDGAVSDRAGSKERWKPSGSGWSSSTASRGGAALTSRLSKSCEWFALLRPRRILQRRLAPILARMDEARVNVGMHIRTGLADWQALAHHKPSTWQEAATAAASSPLSFDDHWSGFEALLRDCSTVRRGGDNETIDRTDLAAFRKLGRPASPSCFLWPSHTSPTIQDGHRCAAAACGAWCTRRVEKGQKVPSSAASIMLRATSSAFEAPSNGTLSAAFACATAFATTSSPRNTAATLITTAAAADDASIAPWKLLVLGDSPALISLASAHPQLGRSRVVHTASAGSLGHTAFDSACSRASCTPTGSNLHDPSGAWTRAMADFYLAGLCDGFVSILFSSFVGAALQRSLLCCGAGRKHFHAHSSPIGSDRDHAQQNSTVLRILM